jgi:hypothetical protein
MGKKARDTVREGFLMTRLLEQHLDLFGSYGMNFTFDLSS